MAFTAYGFLRWITPVDATKAAAEIDVTRVALTVVAGVGGVVALVIAYRSQRDLEQSRFVERFGAAAAQLGPTDVAVRIAGVYAMVGVADESDGLRHNLRRFGRNRTACRFAAAVCDGHMGCGHGRTGSSHVGRGVRATVAS